MPIEKKDWEGVIAQSEAMNINSEISIELRKNDIEYAKKKIIEFPKEKDEMPEGLKDIITGVENA
jgi:hypothetical protein